MIEIFLILILYLIKIFKFSNCGKNIDVFDKFFYINLFKSN